MILSTAAFLCAIGFVAWILGTLFNQTEIAVIGGVLILGVGAMGATDGFQHRAGQIESTNADNETITEFQYERIDQTTNFSAGGLIMLLGGLGIIRALNRASNL